MKKIDPSDLGEGDDQEKGLHTYVLNDQLCYHMTLFFKIYNIYKIFIEYLFGPQNLKVFSNAPFPSAD